MKKHTFRKHVVNGFVSTAILVLATALPGYAGSVRVSGNGADSGTCGLGSEAPCATLGQAIANASEGDTIAVGPGSYAGTVVGKAVSLTSSAGTGAAVITSTVTLAANGAEFGKGGRGFSLTSGSILLSITADEVVVRGNLFSDCTTGIEVTSGSAAEVRDNSFDNCQVGISVLGATGTQLRGNRFGYSGTAAISLGSASTAAVVRENRMFGPSGAGVVVSGADHVVWRNLMHGSPAGGITSSGTPTNVLLRENLVASSGSPAFYLTGGTGWVLTRNAAVNSSAPGFYLTMGSAVTMTGNVAVGNGSDGIILAGGSDHVLVGNSSVDNGGSGLVLSSAGTGITISGGNLYGNGNSNCGLNNSSASAVTTTDVYWGDAAGPGLDPADLVCGNVGAVVVESPADSPASMKMPSIK